MVVAFPLFKLVALFVRQVSRPIANQLKNGAKHSHVFRRFVCLPIAQFYHRVEVTKKMIMMGFGKPVKIPELTEQSAVELGADILGEVIVYSIAAGLFTFEYMRTSEKARLKEEQLLHRIATLEENVGMLEFTVDQHSSQMRSFDRRLYGEKRRHSSPAATTEAQGNDGGIYLHQLCEHALSTYDYSD